jgi:Zn-dependent membrane protease YugP
MQEGLIFLWLLSVGVAMVAWFCMEISLATEGNTPSRRQITGCELARQVLDRNQLSQTAVFPAPGVWRVHFGSDFERLLLAERVYYGTRLSDLAIAFHESAHLLTESQAVLTGRVRAEVDRVLRGGILLSWFLILGGFLFPAWSWLASTGRFLFILVSFRALASLGEEWEVTERALANLNFVEGFGTEERVRIKKLLRVIRWSPLAELFAEPFSFLFQNKKKVSVGVP